MKATILIACTLFSALNACSMDPKYVEHDFGKSVKQMVSAQISDPKAAANPSSSASELLDGVSAEALLEAYRKDAKRENNQQREIRLSVD